MLFFKTAGGIGERLKRFQHSPLPSDHQHYYTAPLPTTNSEPLLKHSVMHFLLLPSALICSDLDRNLASVSPDSVSLTGRLAALSWAAGCTNIYRPV